MSSRVMKICMRSVLDTRTGLKFLAGTYVEAATEFFSKFGSDFSTPRRKPGRNDKITVLKDELTPDEPEVKVIEASRGKQKIVTGEQGARKDG